MAQTAFVRARINEDVKDEAAAVLGEMGLTVSDLVRITLTRVAKDRALPFEIKVPNAETIAAMRESDMAFRKKRLRFATAEALFDDLDKKTRRK